MKAKDAHDFVCNYKKGRGIPAFFSLNVLWLIYHASPPVPPLLCCPHEELKLPLENVDPLIFTVDVPQKSQLDVAVLPFERYRAGAPVVCSKREILPPWGTLR